MTSAAAVYPVRFARLVKIEHTLFALPFAYVGALLAVQGIPSAHDLFWITVAMVGARSLAMGLNRLIDAQLDARNPRTASRELPAGLLTPVQVLLFCVASLAVYELAVFNLDPIVRWLSPIPVIGFVIYPYLKRFTWLCHLWLGAVDGLAPMGAWVAITGKLPLEAWELGGAVAFWVAGFDLFYALFDLDVDRARGAALGGDALRRPRRLLGSARDARAHGRAASRSSARDSTSASPTGSASRSSPRCSRSSTRSSRRTTCAG